MIATTIEQSKHLLELGLYLKTADMYYPYLGSGQYGDIPRVGFPIEHSGGKDIPAWSLSALLEVMSKVRCISYLTIDSSYLVRCKDKGFLWQKDIVTKDPVTATYEMVCWLLEQGLIKKGGQDAR